MVHPLYYINTFHNYVYREYNNNVLLAYQGTPKVVCITGIGPCTYFILPVLACRCVISDVSNVNIDTLLMT